MNINALPFKGFLTTLNQIWLHVRDLHLNYLRAFKYHVTLKREREREIKCKCLLSRPASFSFLLWTEVEYTCAYKCKIYYQFPVCTTKNWRIEWGVDTTKNRLIFYIFSKLFIEWPRGDLVIAFSQLHHWFTLCTWFCSWNNILQTLQRDTGSRKERRPNV